MGAGGKYGLNVFAASGAFGWHDFWQYVESCQRVKRHLEGLNVPDCEKSVPDAGSRGAWTRVCKRKT